jgi:hypothetical protein
MNNKNYSHGFTQRTTLETDLQRVLEINKALIKESYTATISDIDKAVNLQTKITDKDHGLKSAKQKIIDNVLKSTKANDEQTMNDAEQVIRTILSHYPNLSSFVAHVRNELK